MAADLSPASRFARFLSGGRLTGQPTDASPAHPSHRPVARAIGRVGTMALLGAVLATTPAIGQATPILDDPGKATNQLQVPAPQTRADRLLEQGIEMTWFRSSTRPMTTVIYLDRNKLTMATERHGGPDQPAEAEGALPLPLFLQVKRAMISMTLRDTVQFSQQLLEQVPGFKEASVDDGSYGFLKKDIEILTGQRRPESARLFDITRKADNLLSSSLALAEAYDIPIKPEDAAAKRAAAKQASVDALLMDMTLTAAGNLNRQDNAQSLDLLQKLLNPPKPPSKDDGKVMVSDPATDSGQRHPMPAPDARRSLRL